MIPPITLDAVERDVRSSFFGTIDEGALTQILQWASCSSSFTGNNQVDPPEHVFDVNGPFFPLLRKVYKRLMIADDYHDRDHVREVREEFVITPSFAQRVDVLNCLGSNVKGVSILLPAIRNDHDNLVPNMLKFCTDLKSLKFRRSEVASSKARAFVEGLVASFAHSIENICIDGFPRGMKVSNYAFPKLKSLSLSYLPDLDDAILLLQNVGDCLEKLWLTNGMYGCGQSSFTSAPVSKWRELFQAVRANCPHLSSICMDGEELPREDYEQLLISYGPQLRFAGFEAYLNESDDCESMSRVVPQCPNVEFSVVVLSNDGEISSFSALNRLAPHIKELVLNQDEDDSNWEAFESFANRLNKVKTITSSRVTGKSLHALFATPKPTLEILLLRYCYMALSMGRIASGEMKSSMSNLRLFTFNVVAREDVEFFAKMLTVCSNLRRVRVAFDDFCSKREAVGYYNRLLRALRNSKKLEKVDIRGAIDVDRTDDPKEFRNQFNDAQLFRFRRVHISIEGIDILSAAFCRF